MSIKNFQFFASAIVILFVFYVLFVTVTKNNTCWGLDFYFTERVFATSSFEKNDEYSGVIDVIQAFSMSDSKNDFLTIDSLNKQGELIFETREETEIKEILSSLHDKSSEKLSCSDSRKNKTIHILAYDSQLKRVAYFLAYPCIAGHKSGVTALVVPDRNLGLSIFYSQSFGRYISL